ncbi:MAG: InlB B-repeat-containing protein [Clostridia bacterium]|nr:InlB B-repeat-containing protein [Clostridia bacterium]
MKHRCRNLSERVCRTGILLLLTLACLMPMLAAPMAAAADAIAVLDYSNPSSPVVIETGAADFVSMLTGKSLPSAEREYLNTMLGEEVFLYSNAIPVDCVSAEYEGAKLHVRAQSYTYTSASGAQIHWVPSGVTMNSTYQNLNYSYTTGTYDATFSSVNAAQQNRVYVDYTCSVVISATLADYYRNYAYSYAYDLWEENENYERYTEQLAAYEAYIAATARYEQDVAAWENYLVEKEKYDAKYAAYQDYLEDYAEYQTELDAYNAYVKAEAEYDGKLAAYEQYLDDVSSYDQRLQEYELYCAQLARAEEVLAVMESIYAYSSDGKQLYATLMGGTVDQVLNRRNELVQAGVSESAIEQAASATSALKTLLSGYASCSTLAEKLTYYKQNYSSISSNMGSLYGSLYALFQNNSVKWALDEMFDRLHRYMEFVAQLYVVSSGLDDSQARYSGWTITGLANPNEQFIFSYSELLDSNQIPADNNNANPSSLPDLPAPVEEPVVPTPVEKPTIPTPVTKPVEPDTVLEPTAPAPVQQPTEPQPVAQPGAAPAAPDYTDLQRDLIDAIDSGTLAYRSEGSQETIRLSASVSMTVAPAQVSVVTFYDYDGQTVIEQYTLIRGEQITYDGETPTREQSAKYTYTFAGWKTSNGEDALFGEADAGNIAYYAAYDATLRSYTVTWNVDGRTTQQTVAYGEAPSYSENTPVKDPDAQNAYEFVGWSPSLTPVTGDVTYEAMWRAVPRKCTVKWIIDGKEITEDYLLGETPAFKGSTDKAADGDYVYIFRGWDRRLTPLTGDAVFTAVYEQASIAENGSGTTLTVIDTGTVYRIVSDSSRVRINRLLELAVTDDRMVEIVMRDGDATLSLGEALLGDLRSGNCTYIVLSNRTVDGMADACEVQYLDANEKAITPKYNATLITQCLGAACDATRVYTMGADGALNELAATYDAEGGFLTVKFTGGGTLCFRNEFKLNIAQDEEGVQSGVITLPARQSLQDQTVTFTLRHEEGYVVDFVTVTGESSGVVYPLTVGEDGVSYTFTMPAENVVIRSALQLREYTVTFVVDGVEISTAIYHKGDTVTLPESPTKAQQGDTVFTFAGWSPDVTTVNADAIYTATFTSATVGGQDTYVPDYDDGFNFLALYAIIALVLLAGGIVLIIWLRRRKKARATTADVPATEDATANETSEEDVPVIAAQEAPASKEESEETTAPADPQKESKSAVMLAKARAVLATVGAWIKKFAAAVVRAAKKVGAMLLRGGKWLGSMILFGLVLIGKGCKTLYQKIAGNALMDVEELTDAATGQHPSARKKKKTPKTSEIQQEHHHHHHHRENSFDDEDEDEIDFTEFDAYEAAEREKRHHHETLPEEEEDIHFDDEE